MGDAPPAEGRATGALARSWGLLAWMIPLGALLAYAIRVLQARFYGKHDFGLLNLSLSVAIIAAEIALLGLPDAVTRVVAAGGRALRTALLVAVVPALLAAGALVAMAATGWADLWFEPKMGRLLLALAPLVPALAAARLLSAHLKGLRHAGLSSAVDQLVPRAGVAAASLALGLLAAPVVALGAANAGAYVLAAALGAVWAASRPAAGVRARAVDLLAFSWPLTLAAIAGQLTARADTVVLGIYRPAADVGLYHAALPIAGLLGVPQQIALYLFYPVVVRELGARGPVACAELCRTVTRWIFAATAGLYGTVIVFPHAVLSLLFGAEFVGAAPALRLVATAHFALVTMSPSWVLLMAQGRSKEVLGGQLLALGLQIAAAVALVPRWGAAGAAGAVLIGLVVYGLSQWILARRTFPVGWFPWLGARTPYALAVLFAGAYLGLGRAAPTAPWVLAVGLAGGTLAVPVLAWALRDVKPADRLLLADVRRRP